MWGRSSTYIDFCWSPIYCGDRYGGNIGYEYELTTPNEDHTGALSVIEAVFTPMTFGEKTCVRVTGLSCGTGYTIFVSARNSAGSGPSVGILGYTNTGNIFSSDIIKLYCALHSLHHSRNVHHRYNSMYNYNTCHA